MLKQALNKLFVNPQAEDEVHLFRGLIRVMNQRNFAYAKEYHGKNGHVKHFMQYKHAAPRERCCEIADVLMLFIDEIGNLRFTFLQNKRDKKIKYDPKLPLRKIKTDPIQWDLLHYRCSLSNPLNTHLPTDCLSAAILNSVATYGTFLNEKFSNEVEMSYNIARDMTLVTTRAISAKKYSRTYDISTVYNRVNFVNGYWEIEGTTTLDDFETAAQSMLIGTPVEVDNLHHKKIAEKFLSFAFTSLHDERNNYRIYDFNVSHERYYAPLNRCAQRYEVNIEEKTYLPYSLVVVEAKSTYFATKERNINRCRSVSHKLLFDHEKIYKKLQDKNAIVYIDSHIMDDDLQRLLTLEDVKSKAYIVHYDEDDVKLIRADRFNKIR